MWQLYNWIKQQYTMQPSDTINVTPGEQSLHKWREDEKKALELQQILGDLRFDRSVELVLFRRNIYDTRPSELLNNHLFAVNYADRTVNIDETLAIAKAIHRREDIRSCIIDIGKMAVNWLNQDHGYTSLPSYVDRQLDGMDANELDETMPKDVVLYGFGRIGRLLARRIIEQTGRGQQLRLKAIVLRMQMKDKVAEAHKRAALLKTDSVHGDFRGTVLVSEEGDALFINGNRVQLIYASNPTELDYREYDIHDALIIDNTGIYTDATSLEIHLRPGVDKVMLTAPGKKIPNLVYGVNHDKINLDETRIFCAASCTTNAIVPILKTMDEHYGIEKGHIETVHAYTSDQNLLDNFHKKPRRGRAAPLNMVLTSTGAAEAVEAVLPHLAGKLTGNAVRVPTPNVSLAIISLSLKKATSKADLNHTLRQASLHGPLVEQLHYSTSEEFVSSDAVGMTATSIVDAPSTIVSKDGLNITLYAWYDNEYGYSCQVVRLAKHVAKVRRKAYF